jgi:hypothetical protein
MPEPISNREEGIDPERKALLAESVGLLLLLPWRFPEVATFSPLTSAPVMSANATSYNREARKV